MVSKSFLWAEVISYVFSSFSLKFGLNLLKLKEEGIEFFDGLKVIEKAISDNGNFDVSAFTQELLSFLDKHASPNTYIIVDKISILQCHFFQILYSHIEPITLVIVQCPDLVHTTTSYLHSSGSVSPPRLMNWTQHACLAAGGGSLYNIQ